MTLPYERVNAVINTRKFLLTLLFPSLTPRVPRDIRMEARRLLKHYPWDGEAQALATEFSEGKRKAQKNTRKGRRKQKPTKEQDL